MRSSVEPVKSSEPELRRRVAEQKPSGMDRFARLVWVLFIGWLLLGLTQCEPGEYSPGEDCYFLGNGAEWGSGC